MKEKSTDESVIPPDPEQKNDERAEWARVALEEFAEETGLSMEHDLPEVIGDLICDIRHFCDRAGISFEDRLRNAQMHYEAETDPENPDCFPADESEVQS